MKRDKILSIIIPTYNMEKYLHKCLNSLIVTDENMRQLEVLVINDGSKDLSSQIAHEYEMKYPQTIRVIDKPNGNYGSCINRGLKEATGKYVKVLDADDYFDKEVFDVFISFLTEVDADLVISNYCMVNNEGAAIQMYTFPVPVDRDFSMKDVPKDAVNRLWHHGVTYKMEIFQKLEYKQTEGISYTDDEWIFKPMIYVDKIRYFSHNLYFYLRGREGQTFDPQVKKNEYRSRLVVAKSLSDFVEAWKDKGKDENMYFLKIKFISRIRNIYSYYILQTHLEDDLAYLKDFDIYIRENSPSVYEITDKIQNKFKVYYVRKWRESHYNEKNWLLSSQRVLYRVARLLFSRVLDAGI